MNTAPVQHLNRLFIAIAIPPRAREILKTSLVQFQDAMKRPISENNWHMTLLFLGQCPNIKGYLARLTKPIPQPFVPTVTITHIGRGAVKRQLWAYASVTPNFEQVRTELVNRLKTMRFQAPGLKEKRLFVPHIRLADLEGGKILADKAAAVNFAVREVVIYRSHPSKHEVTYEAIGTVPLAPS